ncbi:unnamed protein product [Musa hybrid cultivar]
MAGVWFLPPLTSSTNGGFNSQLLFSFSYYIGSFDQKSLSKWVEDLSLPYALPLDCKFFHNNLLQSSLCGND